MLRHDYGCPPFLFLFFPPHLCVRLKSATKMADRACKYSQHCAQSHNMLLILAGKRFVAFQKASLKCLLLIFYLCCIMFFFFFSFSQRRIALKTKSIKTRLDQMKSMQLINSCMSEVNTN